MIDPQALTVFGRVSTGLGNLGPRLVMGSVVDPPTGHVIGASADPANCVSCFPAPDGIVVIDPVNLKLVVDQRLGAPVQLVH